MLVIPAQAGIQWFFVLETESRPVLGRDDVLLCQVSEGCRLVNRIDRRFHDVQSRERKALIPFITAGDPSREATVPVMHALVKAGADLIELGVPFSDPMADGPVIQHADERALRRRVGIADILDWVRGFRAHDTDTPIVLMGYLNPIEQYRSAGQSHPGVAGARRARHMSGLGFDESAAYAADSRSGRPWPDRHRPSSDAAFGIERFAREAVDAGVDGVLVVDCPVEEDATLQPLRDAGLQRILLVAPTTSDTRLARAAEAAEGYLYYVSFAGITGASKSSAVDIAQRVGDLRVRAKVPVAVGFGIKDAEDAKTVAGFADAVVIGSALVETLADAVTPEEASQRARDFIAPIRAALDRG
jgi:tryptophan synthase alpha chain